MQKITIVTFLTLLFSNFNIIKSEFFKNDKSLDIIREQSRNLNCIRVHASNLEEFVFKFLLKIKVPMVISKELATSERRAEISLCPNIIVQLKSVERLAAIFKSHVSHRSLIFILLSQNFDWYKIWGHSTYYWNKYKMYKAFYITTDSTKFFHPFVTLNDKHGVLVDTRNYNFNDIFKNFNGYPVKVIIFDSVFSKVKKEQGNLNPIGIEGVDAEVALLLADTFNFTMKFQKPCRNFFGARLENGSFDGALGRLIRYEADITMTGFFVKDYLTRDVKFSVSVYMDKLCCYVIKSKRIPVSILPLYAVDTNVWVVYMIVGFFSSFVWILFRVANLYMDKYGGGKKAAKRTFSKKMLSNQYASVIADTWILWLRMVIVRFPPYNSERIFAISLCLVSVIIEALFASSLATTYIRPRYYKDINTLKELENANIRVFIKHAAMRDDLFRGQDTKLYKSLDERVMLVGEPEERLISIMSKRGGFAAVTREFSLLIGDIYYFLTNKIRIIPECPKTYHIAYVYTNNSPYEETFNVALLQFLAAGLIDHWIDMSRHKAQCYIRNHEDFMAENNYQWKTFKLNDLRLAFHVLIFGNICAILLFIAEIIIKKIIK